MEAQVAKGRAVEALSVAQRADFSGVAIDHANGGRVTIAATNHAAAEQLTAHFADFGVPVADSLIVKHNDAELSQRAEAMTERLARSTPSISQAPQIEISRSELGRVTLTFVRGSTENSKGPPDLAQILSEALADPETYIVNFVDSIETDSSAANECDMTGNLECDPPLRGSVWIRLAGIRTCSAGFNVRSKSDDKPYVLTTGHCDHGETAAWYTDFEDDSDHFIGPFHNSREDAQTDSGILRVNNPTGWQFGQPWITVSPNAPVPYASHARNERYTISDVLDPGLGDRICATTGNSVYTTCGNVTATSQTNSEGVQGLFRVENLCGQGGDSGSPLFSYGVAYGIFVSKPTSTLCTWVRGEQAKEAADWMNVYILES